MIQCVTIMAIHFLNSKEDKERKSCNERCLLFWNLLDEIDEVYLN